MIMKKVIFILGMLLSLGMFSACSNSDEDVISKGDTNTFDEVLEVTQMTLVGKWKLIREGDFEIEDSNISVEFFEDGKVKYEIGHTDNYHLIESQIEFEDDWTLLYDNGIVTKMYGHIQFMIGGRGENFKTPNRFFCEIENDELYLLPDEGLRYCADPSQTFIKIN